jgi:hypothetical protein
MFKKNYNLIGSDIKKSQRQFSCIGSLQQKLSLYAKWFHWILSEFIGLVNKD